MMDWKTLFNDASLMIALIFCIAGIVIVTLWESGWIANSQLPTIGLVLAGALAGVSTGSKPKP